MRLIVTGSRSIKELNAWIEAIKWLREIRRIPTNLSPREAIQEGIVGDADGVDKIAAAWFQKHGIRTSVYKAKWHQYQKRAGIMRNLEMRDEGLKTPRAVVLAVWDMDSSGTRHMIECCRQEHLEVEVFNARKWAEKRQTSGSATEHFNLRLNDKPGCSVQLGMFDSITSSKSTTTYDE